MGNVRGTFKSGIMTQRVRQKEETMEAKKKILGLMTVFAVISAAVGVKDGLEAKSLAGWAMRQQEGAYTQTQTFAYRIDGGEEEEVAIEISPVQRSGEDARKLLEQAVKEWEEEFLGSNASADDVRSDLDIPSTLCEGLVKVSCESSNYDILQSDGTIAAENIPDDGEIVSLTVKLSYGDYEQIEVYSLYVKPPEKGSADWLRMQLADAVSEAEEVSRSKGRFALPETVEGHRVEWVQERNYEWIYILLLGAVSVFALQLREKENQKKQKKMREQQLLTEYPQMVYQLSVLLDSGMTIRRAWERMLQTDEKMARDQGNGKKQRRIFVSEMRITYREIREGRGERDAYERFGRRIGLMPYQRLGTLLSRVLQQGSRDLRNLLEKEASEALEMRKNRAVRLGEEAGTKMLFPMLGMLLLILLVLLLPALGNL